MIRKGKGLLLRNNLGGTTKNHDHRKKILTIGNNQNRGPSSASRRRLLFLKLLVLLVIVSSRKYWLLALGLRRKSVSELEREQIKLHQRSQPRAFKELSVQDDKQQEILHKLIQEELKQIPVLPFVSWGVYHMYRNVFPPELNITNIRAENSYDGQPPAVSKLVQDNQILIAHRVPNRNRLNYAIQHWEDRIAADQVKNVGIYLMGDEKNFGSSFLNDRLDGSSSPFAFVIRDYYFERLRNAQHTRVVQLGTMTCGNYNQLQQQQQQQQPRRRMACSVKPRDTVFASLLPPAAKLELRPETLLKPSQRSRPCYWAGSNRNDRQAMVEYFQNSGGCKVFMTPGFNMGDNKTLYANILSDTVFGLVPRGNSPETHRLTEVLMFGGIPVLLESDAQEAYIKSYPQPIPMITGRTWEEAEQSMKALLRDTVRLDQMQQQVLQWWDRHWQCVHDDVRWILAQAHAVSQGRDLCEGSGLPVQVHETSHPPSPIS